MTAQALIDEGNFEDFNSHAHVERDTDFDSGSCSYGYFNSHAHVERDEYQIRYSFTNYLISTHTLTWSVTFTINGYRRTEKHFNSHAHVERDNGESTDRAEILDFNSHAHVERDSPVLRATCRNHHFNSHAHVERDIRLGRRDSCRRISTHTLTWSVTHLSRCAWR